ncbi:unnamed protein product [Rotaria magnacalcarata]|uniref:LIM zinc-binding domain-containing protein n=1 Tax=Rotaria magnacalcarata TaxID=392030 RepID=A0A814HS90_9BILA|nr:unnamed protein product [Rotaria magnacalcarata]CAF1346786.1 unnamed protein product [Rotaria magnacalcarata]CAF2009057.1 unnamed protein product [Rotaria magnacalcarata]CAF3814404.1 unnamed protein product [Rotaria magnacalcarata]CAF3850150.1 unnamed protein product [Rotaria magnacalcarata]
MAANHCKTTVIKCRACYEEITLEEKYLHDGENVVHIDCYICSSCHRSLAGIFYYRYKDPRHNDKKKLYCDSCYYSLAPICFQCLKIIDDVSLIFGERIFHPNCFCCEHCRKSFKGALVFPYENHVYCSNCYQNVQTDFQPAPSIVSTLRCSICRKVFQSGDLITKHEIDLSTDKISSKIHYIHNSCFVCGVCHQNLSDSTYFTPNTHDDDIQNLVFQCEKCHETSATICSICFRPSNDLMIIFNNRWYHDQCFTCKNCNYKLKNLTRIITEPDRLLCERCLKSIHDQQQQL